MVKAVIFDVNGTLIDTDDLYVASWAETFRRFGHAVAPEAGAARLVKAVTS